MSTLITPVEIALALSFTATLVGSIWFCLKNYPINPQRFDR
ncbi:MAG: hypothetical protein PHE55_12805 [Methylococcaceae bacterium]|nr:hypothetical protein [Methylococcaceae bacterium]